MSLRVVPSLPRRRGPDVEMGTCKTPGDQDSNQQWLYNAATQQLTSLSSGAYGLCLAAAPGPAGGQLATVDSEGNTWCLTGSGAEGQWHAGVCKPGGGGGGSGSSQMFQPFPVGGQPGNFTLVSSGGSVAWNGQYGASGPLPHSRYITQGGGVFTFNLSALVNGTGTTIVAASNAIINDDLVGNVTTGGVFCLDVSTIGMLEVWMAPLTGSRVAVVLNNRSPGDDTITATWATLGLSPSARYDVFDIWANVDRGTFAGSYTATVVSHGVAFLVLTPSA